MMLGGAPVAYYRIVLLQLRTADLYCRHVYLLYVRQNKYHFIVSSRFILNFFIETIRTNIVTFLSIFKDHCFSNRDCHLHLQVFSLFIDYDNVHVFATQVYAKFYTLESKFSLFQQVLYVDIRLNFI